jgi:hypothetical protein
MVQPLRMVANLKETIAKVDMLQENIEILKI